MKQALNCQPEYVAVKDLGLFQHYKHRCPPWVKLHWSLLDNHAFVSLSETDRHRFIFCVLFASRVENRIRNDPNYLARIMRLTDPVDLTPLLNCGLLLACRKQSASKLPAACKQSALSETETEREKRKKLRVAVDTVNPVKKVIRIVSTVGSRSKTDAPMTPIGVVLESLSPALSETFSEHLKEGQ